MIIRTAGSQKESQVMDIQPSKPNPILHYNIEYDTTHPEETIRKFCTDIREMVTRYEGNKQRLIEIEGEHQDLLHYIEISPFKKVPDGYKLYRKLAELRRERRALKNENDLLQPLYDAFRQPDILNKLGKVQGDVSKVHDAIDGRVYGMRTDVLNDWFEPEKKEEPGVTVVEAEEPEVSVDIPEVNDEVEDAVDDMIDQKDIRAAQAKFKLAWSAAGTGR